MQQTTFFSAICVSALLLLVLFSGIDAGIVDTPQDSFYANWMGQLAPFVRPYSLLDLSVAGTHDTMTYTLSNVVADNANDLPNWMARILHQFGKIIAQSKIGNFIRFQARTQGLNITQQLKSGLRFLDFRIDYTAPPGVPSNDTTAYDWFCLHLVESRSPAMQYLQEIRDFLLAHPTELIVIWISHHGNDCGGNYSVSNSTQQKFWARIQALFGPLLYDRDEIGLLNETSVGTLIDKGQRVVVYLNQIHTFVPGGRSGTAQSDCDIDNDCDPTGHGPSVVSSVTSKFDGATITKRMSANKRKNRFYLLGLAGSSLTATYGPAFEIEFLGPLKIVNTTALTEQCAAALNVPAITQWCPKALQERGQWANYYRQIAFDWAMRAQQQSLQNKRLLSLLHNSNDNSNNVSIGARFPNAIYLDALDVNGTIRTGPQLFFADNETSKPLPNGAAKYAYVATLLLSNVNLACSGAIVPLSGNSAPSAAACAAATGRLKMLRAQYPVQRWTDLAHGRLRNWPPTPPLPGTR